MVQHVPVEERCGGLDGRESTDADGTHFVQRVEGHCTGDSHRVNTLGDGHPVYVVPEAFYLRLREHLRGIDPGDGGPGFGDRSLEPVDRQRRRVERAGRCAGRSRHGIQQVVDVVDG